MNSRFIALFNGFCEIAQLAARPLLCDDAGAHAAQFTLGNIDVLLLCEPGSADRFFSRVDFGPLPQGDQAQQWDELLETNFLIFRAGGAAFSRDPGTGHAVLQQAWPATTTPQVLLGAISLQCDTARHWRSATLDLPAVAQEWSRANPDNKV